MIRRLILLVLAVSLSGCTFWNALISTPSKSEPVDLTEFKATLSIKQLWKASVGGAGRFFFFPAVVGNDVVVAGSKGTVARLNASTGADVWRRDLGEELSAGVGSDDLTLAVATSHGDLIALETDGTQRWRSSVGAEVLSAPIVGFGLVVVRTTDGKFIAYDSASGKRRWVYSRQSQPLVLRSAPGMIMADGLLFAGLPGGRLIALTVTNGGLRWESSVANPKGATELERVADVVGYPLLSAREICVATYQGRVGCFDEGSGNPIWGRDLSTFTGIALDQRTVFVSDEKSVVQALARPGGTSIWKNDKMQFRLLTVPAVFGQAIVVGDYQGYVHWLSHDDGSLLARMPTDGSAIKVNPIALRAVSNFAVLVQTVDGDIFAFSAE